MGEFIGRFIGKWMVRVCFSAGYRLRIWPIIPYYGLLAVAAGIAYLLGADGEPFLFQLIAGAAGIVYPAVLLLRARQWFRVPLEPRLMPDPIEPIDPSVVREYVGQGFRMKYPRRWKLDEEVGENHCILSIQGGGSAILLLAVVTGPAEMDGFAENTWSAFVQAIEQQGGRVTLHETNESEMRVGSAVVPAQERSFTLDLKGSTLPHTREYCRLSHGATDLHLVVQAADVDRPNARIGFDLILASLYGAREPV